jgi:hypothetical protein
VDDDIVTKQYFPRARMDQRKKLKTFLIIAEANGSLVVVGIERGQQRLGPGNLSKNGLQAK